MVEFWRTMVQLLSERFSSRQRVFNFSLAFSLYAGKREKHTEIPEFPQTDESALHYLCWFRSFDKKHPLERARENKLHRENRQTRSLRVHFYSRKMRRQKLACCEIQAGRWWAEESRRRVSEAGSRGSGKVAWKPGNTSAPCNVKL